jgi:hypothetical protein
MGDGCEDEERWVTGRSNRENAVLKQAGEGSSEQEANMRQESGQTHL